MAGSIFSRNAKYQREAAGNGLILPIRALSQAGGVTTATNGSMDVTMSMRVNATGTTFPGTLINVLPIPPGSDPLRLSLIQGVASLANHPLFFGWLYKIGTQVLTATGDQFTHDAATFPITRKIQNQASSPLDLWPIIQITTATTTTPAVLTLKTAAGAAGYTDQDGNSIVGARTFTMPAAATAVNSCYLLPLEDGDSGVRNINAIQTNTAAAAGAAAIWGFEPLRVLRGHALFSTEALSDAVFGGLSMNDMRPGVATSGSVTAVLAFLTVNNGSASATFSGSAALVGDTA